MTIEAHLASKETFLAHRLNYYAQEKIIEPSGPVSLKLRRLKPDAVIITASNNRLLNLRIAHQKLTEQQGKVNWAWLIVDNKSTDGTSNYFQDLKDDRIVVVSSGSKLGCAYPVRNFGLDITAATFWGGHYGRPQIIVIDSDDHLFGSHSLHELSMIDRSNRSLALVHGYSDTIIHYSDGNSEHVANPRDTSSSFPKVENLAETLYKGLNILAGAFPIELLSRLRYPAERSFEDGGFNEKLMLMAQKHGQSWLEHLYPITIKHFHKKSMSEINNGQGDVTKIDKVGPYQVSGIRADIVSYYRSLMDYFTREDL